MKRLIGLTLLLLLAAGTAGPAHAQGVDLRGSLRLWARGFISSPKEVDLLESRLKLEVVSTLGEHGAFFARLYGVSDARATGQARSDDPLRLTLQEAYVDYYTDRFTLRVGRQIMAWGKADEINPTDVLNPQDLSNLLEEKLIRKSGIFAVKANWFFGDFDLETIWKPEFKPMLLPEPGSRWFPFPLPAGSTDLPPMTLPGRGFQDTEWAVRLSRTVGRFDLSITRFSGWDHIFTPVIALDPITQQAALVGRRFHRTRMLGGSFAGSVGSIGIWGEGAYFRTEDPEGNRADVRNPYVQLVLGSDYTFGSGLRLNIQYFRELLTRIDDSTEERLEKATISKLGLGIPLRRALTARLALPFGFGEAHSVEAFAIYDLEESGFLLGPKLVLSPEPAFKVEVGAVLLSGEEGSLFNRLERNDNAYVRITVSF